MNIEIGTGSPETNGRTIRENGRYILPVNRNSTIWFNKGYHRLRMGHPLSWPQRILDIIRGAYDNSFLTREVHIKNAKDRRALNFLATLHGAGTRFYPGGSHVQVTWKRHKRPCGNMILRINTFASASINYILFARVFFLFNEVINKFLLLECCTSGLARKKRGSNYEL
ncbi:hypothetical protein PUN28_017374 [Cardiocondyla obscurior]|uniref:Ribosomal protein L22 n=1 Tax=Cardiocondyla obscurior TaxID=286306 RepID=A0AAW2EQF8_9HYME